MARGTGRCDLWLCTPYTACFVYKHEEIPDVSVLCVDYCTVSTGSKDSLVYTKINSVTRSIRLILNQIIISLIHYERARSVQTFRSRYSDLQESKKV